MSPLETMAKAYFESERLIDKWDELLGPEKQEVINAMRAALAALRDCGVTDAMHEAWKNATLPSPGVTKGSGSERDFRAMLDAALKE